MLLAEDRAGSSNGTDGMSLTSKPLHGIPRPITGFLLAMTLGWRATRGEWLRSPVQASGLMRSSRVIVTGWGLPCLLAVGVGSARTAIR